MSDVKCAVDFVGRMTVPGLVWSPDGALLATNAALETVAAASGRPARRAGQVRAWALAAPVKAALTRALEENVTVTCHDLVFAKGKKKTWFSLYVFPWVDPDRSAVVALFFETTDRVVVESSLRDSERQLSAVFSNAPVGLSLIAADGRFVRVNDALCNMLGRTREQLLASGVADVTHPDDLIHSLRAVGHLLATGEATSLDKRYVHADGHVLFANSSITRIHVGKNGDFLILAVTVDLTERQRTLDALAASEARFRALAEASSAFIWQMEPDGSVSYLNPRHQELLGMPAEQLLGFGWSQVLHPEELDATVALIEDAIARQIPAKERIRIRYADGAWRWIEMHVAPWRDSGGNYAGHVGIAIDIDEAVRAQDELNISNERLKLAVEGSGDGIWDWDLRTNRTVYTERARVILGLSENPDEDPEDFIGSRVHPDDAGPLRAALQACFTGATAQFQMEFRVRRPEGGWRWILSRASAVSEYQQEHLPQRLTGTVTDIADKRSAEEEVWHHANFDPLTGLPNRRLFRDRLDHEIKKSQRTKLPLALLFIDLDRFKEANDLLGHTIGDQVLLEAARRICGCVRQSDTVARLGGDEFTAILSELEGGVHVAMHIDPIARKINEALSKPYYLGNEVVYLSGSIGITLYPYDASNAENLIRNADQAMYVVKNAGRNHFSYFTPSMQRVANERLRLISDLRAALEAKQLRVFYQPIVDLRTGRVTKAEALLRWFHPTLGMLEPSRFITFAEEAGLISDIGDWVFREAALRARRWGERVGAPFQISVNKSPVQFLSRLNEVDWPTCLDQLGICGNSVSIEITEGLLLDASPSVSDKLTRYQKAGIKVAIDDFGTGYSSIAYLKKFEVDYLKIDQSFVRDIPTCTGDRAIVRSIIAMAHELGLQVIAEGIECALQRDFLVEGQCDFGQGFLYSKALPPEEFERVLLN